MAMLLKKFVNADEWEAEDIVGRLGMVFHTAFSFAGFHPYGAQPPSGHLLKQSSKRGNSVCLSRCYTAPELARRTGADAAVLMLCSQGRDVAILMFLTTDNNMESTYLERLDLETVRPLLSRSLGGVEPRGSQICRSLADGVCWGLLHEICRNNRLPLTSFMSLPDDLKVAILKRITCGKDLARMECVSAEMRLLVTEHDGELWKPLFEAMPKRQLQHLSWWDLWQLFCGKGAGKKVRSWKKAYVDATPRSCSRIWCPLFSDPLDNFQPIRFIDIPPYPVEYWIQDPPEQEEKVSSRGERTCGHGRKKAAWNEYKKQKHCSGAIHSPSSRYRWKHR